MSTKELARELRARVAIVHTLAEIAGGEQVDEEWARLIGVLFQFARECATAQELRQDAAE